MKNGTNVVFLLVENLLVVSLAQKRENRSVKTVGRLDYKRDISLVRFRIKVFKLLSGILLMSRKVEIRSVVSTVDFTPAERKKELDIARGLCVVSEFFVVVIS